MAKKKKGKKRGAAPSTGPELRERIRVALERGKGRQALDAAKALCKLEPGEDSDALLLGSYLARIAELARSGLAADALRLTETVRVRFPESAATIDRQGMAVEARGGNLDGVLKRFAAPGLGPEDRRALTEIVRCSVRDPSEVADSEALPPGHPLREDARRTAELLRRSIAGPLAPDDPGLTAVSRRSPLASFVLLARAIDAAHRGDRPRLAKLLERIPEDCAAARAAPALRALVKREFAPGLSPASRRLLGAALGEDRDLGALIREVEDAILAKRLGVAARLAAEVRTRLRRSSPGLLPEFRRVLSIAWFARDLDPPGFRELLGVSELEEAEYWRVTALALERERYTETAIQCWDNWHSSRGGPTTALEVATIRRHQAHLAQTVERERAFDLLSEVAGDFSDDLGEESIFDGPAGQEGRAIEYMEQAVRAHPSSQMFADYYRLCRSAVLPAHSRAVAERWREAHPADVEPILALADAAEDDDAEAVLALLEEAHALAPLDPRVRESRRDAMVRSARSDLRRGRNEEARRCIARLRELDTAAAVEGRWFLDLLSWFATDDAEERAGIFGRLREEAGDASARYLLSAAGPQLQARRLVFSLPAKPAPTPPEAVSRALATAWRVFRWGGLDVPRDRDHLAALNRALADGFTPAVADLEPLGELYLQFDLVAGLHYISRIGLSGQSARRHWFLFLRARGLGRSQARETRRRRCLLAARELALRVGDDRVVAEVGEELFYDGWGDDLAPGEAEKILAREARAGLADAPGHKKRSKGPKQGRLFT